MEIPLGPWKGVRDVGDAGQQDPAYLQDAINCWFQDPARGGSVYARPGCERLTSAALESGGPDLQATFSAVINGSVVTFAFINGKVYRQAGASSWTDVTPVAPTISTVAERIAVILYNGELIVNDGSNKPWRGTNLASTPITGTNIEVNSTPSDWTARGKPTVHGAKLFFIVNTISGSAVGGSRIVWSEEASAATGYLQTGYTNSWDLIQSEVLSDRVYAIQGTNDGLYFFRGNSIGLIAGAVNATFTTDSTHDGISNDVGIWFNTTGTPLAWAEVTLAKGYLWFIDNGGRPCRLALGSKEIDPLWTQMRHRLRLARGQSGSASIETLSWPQTVYLPDLDKIVMLFLAIPGNAGTTLSTSLYIFDAKTGNYEGRWILALTSQPASESSGTNIKSIGLGFRDSNLDAPGVATLLIGTGSAISGSHVWHQTALRMYGSDSASLGDNAGAMHMSITLQLLPGAKTAEFSATELTVEAVPDSVTMSVDRWTPAGQLTTLTPTGLTNTDSIQSSHDHGIYRVGLLDVGRWLRYVLHWNVPAGAAPYAFERGALRVMPRPATGYTK